MNISNHSTTASNPVTNKSQTSRNRYSECTKAAVSANNQTTIHLPKPTPTKPITQAYKVNTIQNHEPKPKIHHFYI